MSLYFTIIGNINVKVFTDFIKYNFQGNLRKNVQKNVYLLVCYIHIE